MWPDEYLDRTLQLQITSDNNWIYLVELERHRVKNTKLVLLNKTFVEHDHPWEKIDEISERWNKSICS